MAYSPEKGGINPRDLGAVGDGATIDTIALNAASTRAHATTGHVTINPTPNGYAVGRRITGLNHGGGIRLRPGMRLQGQNTLLVLKDNCGFIDGSGILSPPVAITANVAYGAYTITVASLTTSMPADPYTGWSSFINKFPGGTSTDPTWTLAAGQTILVRMVTTPSNPFEPVYWYYARIVSIAGLVLTLDEPCPVPTGFNVTTEEANEAYGPYGLGGNPYNRCIAAVGEMISNAVVSGFYLSNDATGGNNAEQGVCITYGSNLLIEGVRGTNTGAGVFTLQFVNDAVVMNCGVDGSVNQGAPSKGTACELYECRDVEIINLFARGLTCNFIHLEAACQNISVRGGRVVLDSAANLGGGGGHVIAVADDSQLRVDGLLIEGDGSLGVSGGANLLFVGTDSVGEVTPDTLGTEPDIVLKNVSVQLTKPPYTSGPLKYYEPPLTIGPLKYVKTRIYNFVVPIVAGTAPHYIYQPLPPALMRRMKANLSTTTGVYSITVNDTVNGAVNTTLYYGGTSNFATLGTWGEVSGICEYGTIVPINDPSVSSNRQLVISTTPSAPVGSSLQIQLECYIQDDDPLVEAWERANLSTPSHQLSQGIAPTVTLGTGAGTTPGAVTVTGNDTAGSISFSTGTTPAASATILTLTFATPYATSPQTVVITPGNAATAAVASFYHNQGSLSTASFVLSSATAALPASTPLVFCYRVEG